jgi:hypothetical protein
MYTVSWEKISAFVFDVFDVHVVSWYPVPPDLRPVIHNVTGGPVLHVIHGGGCLDLHFTRCHS